MTVYAEQIFIDNLLIDAAILYATCRILARRVRVWRIVLGAGIGSVSALLSAILGGSVLPWIFKIVTAPIMVLVCCKHTSARSYCLTLGVMLGITVALGGVCYGLLCAFGADVLPRIPIGLLTVAVVALSIVIEIIARHCVRRRNESACECEVEVVYADKKSSFTAFLDTGNTLRDSHNGLPIILADIAVLEKLFYDGAYLDYLNCGEIKDVSGRKTVCNSIHGSSEIFVFSPQEVWIYLGNSKHRIVDVMIGLDVLSMPKPYMGLLNPVIFAGV